MRVRVRWFWNEWCIAGDVYRYEDGRPRCVAVDLGPLSVALILRRR